VNYDHPMSGEGSTAAGLLRELRKKQGRSLRAAANDLGLAASHLSRLERGERSLTEGMSQRVAGYYGVSPDVVMMTEGRVPDDVIAILRHHPELIDQMRKRYGAENSEDVDLGSSK
jgi:transcriptional regulator with XRE-family HTH domain